jgi:hypothetical protein
MLSGRLPFGSRKQRLRPDAAATDQNRTAKLAFRILHIGIFESTKQLMSIK